MKTVYTVYLCDLNGVQMTKEEVLKAFKLKRDNEQQNCKSPSLKNN